MEERFNASSAGIRSLTSAWLLAGLGSLGWLLNSYNPDTWPLPLGFLAIIIATLCCIGMITLWVMDQLVFHRLLSSVFLIGLKIEKDNPEIPPIRSLMMKTQEGLGTHRWEKFFYMTPILVFLLLSCVLLVGGSSDLFAVNKKFFSLNTFYLSMILVTIQTGSTIWMMRKLPSMSLETRAEFFNDKKFAQLVKEKKFDSTIANFIPNTKVSTNGGMAEKMPN